MKTKGKEYFPCTSRDSKLPRPCKPPGLLPPRPCSLGHKGCTLPWLAITAASGMWWPKLGAWCGVGAVGRADAGAGCWTGGAWGSLGPPSWGRLGQGRCAGLGGEVLSLQAAFQGPAGCWGGLQPHDPEQVKRGRRSYCLRPFSALPGSCWRPVAKAGVRKAAPELELLPIWKRVWPKGPWSLELLGQACPSPEEAVVTSGRWGPLFLPGAEERPRRSLL